MTKLQALENAYFDKLEENQVDFVERDDAGKSLVKDEFVVSVEEMCDYLEMPEWVKRWTLDLISEEEDGVVIDNLNLGLNPQDEYLAKQTLGGEL